MAAELPAFPALTPEQLTPGEPLAQPVPLNGIERLARIHPGWFAFFASGGAWQPARHQVFLSELLRRVATGEIKRLIVSMPPGHGKSWMISRYFPAWYLGVYPDRQVILASYSDTYAATWGAQARNVLQQVGPSLFGVTAPPGSGEREWATARVQPDGSLVELEAGMKTAGIRGGLTGRRGHVLIVDDPVKDDEEAHSPRLRQKNWEWFQAVFMTRIHPESSVVIVMTRWHHDDLVGRCIAQDETGDGEGWTVVNLPALAEEEDQLGRAPGEPLWPIKWSEEHLRRIRRARGSYVWSALFQGRPTPTTGGMFQKDWVRRFAWLVPKKVIIFPAGGQLHRVHLEDCVLFGVADLATSVEEGADHSAIGAFAVTPTGYLFLLQMLHRKLEAPEFVPLLESMVEDWDLGAVWIESQGYQLSMVQTARKAGLPVHGLSARGTKETRALSAAAAMEGERAFVGPGAWEEGFLKELGEFPRSKHDDQVDVWSHAVRLAPRVARVFRKRARPARVGGAGSYSASG